MVNILSEKGLQMSEWNTFKQNLGYIENKTEQAINQLKISDSALMINDVSSIDGNMRTMLDCYYQSTSLRTAQTPVIAQKMQQLLELLGQVDNEV